MERMEYRDARDMMRAGDVIAFGGKGNFSNIIKAFTRSPVSHVGIIMQTHINGDGRVFNEIAESTSLNGFSGVIRSRLSARLASYNGEVWWMPLSNEVRERFDEKAFFDFLFAQDGKPYDKKQAIGSAIDGIPFIGQNKEDFDRLFCSELNAGALEAAGVIDVNSSEVTPIELVRWNLYRGVYQLTGEDKEIPRFNTVPIIKKQASQFGRPVV